MPPPPAPVARAHFAVAKKTSTRSISPKALSSGARPLKKFQATSMVSNKSSIIARLQGDPALPPSSHSPLPKTTMPTVQPDEENTASHFVAQGASCAPKKKCDEKNISLSPRHDCPPDDIAPKKKKDSESLEPPCNTPTIVEQDPFNARGQSRAPMDTAPHVASGEDAIDVDSEKKHSPTTPCTTNPVQATSSKNPSNRFDRLGSSLAMHRAFKPMPPPSAPRSLDGHLASLDRHDAASVESKSSTASKAKTDDMTPHEVLRSAFAPPAPFSVAPTRSSQCGDGRRSPVASMSFTPLPSNPIKRAKLFLPHGALPNGFPEARDLTADVNANKLAVRGQSRFSRMDLVSSDPPLYLDSTPLPPAGLLRSLTPPPQILLNGDGLPYPGFLRTLSIADIHGLDWSKLIGLVSFLLLPAFSLFQDEGPFLAHKTYVKNVVNMPRDAKKQNKATTVWLAYTSRSNVSTRHSPRQAHRPHSITALLIFVNSVPSDTSSLPPHRIPRHHGLPVAA